MPVHSSTPNRSWIFLSLLPQRWGQDSGEPEEAENNFVWKYVLQVQQCKNGEV